MKICSTPIPTRTANPGAKSSNPLNPHVPSPQPHPVAKVMTEQEPRPGPSGIKQPVKPKQITPTGAPKKKDPLRIQKRVIHYHTAAFAYCFL